MPKRFLYITVLIITVSAAGFCSPGQAQTQFGTYDLYFRGSVANTYDPADDEHIIVFPDGFELEYGDSTFTSSSGVIWVKTIHQQYRGQSSSLHQVVVCMPSKAQIKQGPGSYAAGIEITQNQLTGEKATIAEFDVVGQLFINADKRTMTNPRNSALYRRALIATGQLEVAPAKMPVTAMQDKKVSDGGRSALGPPAPAKAPKPNIFERISGSDRTGRLNARPGQDASASAAPGQSSTAAPKAAPRFRYPVNISSATSQPVKIFKQTTADGESIATILNRFYLWQKQNEAGDVLEFTADSAVIFYSEKSTSAQGSDDPQKLLGDSAVKGIYFSGNCVMTHAGRTLRCSQMYYDFQYSKALAVNSVIKTYSEQMGIPLFVRAEKMRQICTGKYAAENAQVTNSEFHTPQIAITAGKIVATDEDAVDIYGNKIGRKYGWMEMEDVRFKQDGKTFFYLPKLSGPMDWVDLPIRRASFGYDSDAGFVAETEWYLARLLGMREPEDVESTLLYDYSGERGSGVGMHLEYDRDDYFGKLHTYIVRDRGTDDLSRNRQNVRHGKDYRGSVQFQHRHFLPYDWQMTLEASYLSDENYHESYFRDQFLSGKDQETLIHLKRLRENWGFSILGKWRINDFYDQTEQLPSAQYHLAGESIFDDKFTLYNDTYAGRFRQRIGHNHRFNIPEDFFTFISSRTELDMPLNVGNARIVPYIAGTFGYDDRSGFADGLVDGTMSDSFGSKEVFIGEAGVRGSRQFWRLDKSVKSEFWDLNGIRHIVKPYFTAALFAESDNEVDQRNTANIGLLQRWQTKRGRGEKQRIVEWMRLNIDYTWVEDPDSSPARPDRFSSSRPYVPLAVMSMPEFFNSDAAQFGQGNQYGPQTSSINADYIWRISDTTSLMTDMNYDVEDGDIEQYNIGIARYRWPNLSYYIGTRYLPGIRVPGENNVGTEKGSNALVFAATYRISPRYTLSATYQYDFDYGRRTLQEISLIRRYHRVYYGFTFRRDETLDSHAVMFNIWPEGLGSMFSGRGSSLGIDSPAARDY